MNKCINCDGRNLQECGFCPFPNKKHEKEVTERRNNKDATRTLRKGRILVLRQKEQE